MRSRRRDSRATLVKGAQAATWLNRGRGETFGAADVARILGVPVSRVYAMTRAELCQPARHGRAFEFSFQDLVLLRAAHDLIQKKVPTRRVRQALRELSRHLAPGRPLSAVRICADGRQVVVRDGRTAWEPDSGQMVLQFDLRKLARDAGVIAPTAARRPVTIARKPDRRRAAFVWFDQALALEQDDPGAARAAYLQALEINPLMSDAYINLGRLMHEAGDRREAMRLYRLALEQAPDDPVAHYNVALVLEDDQDPNGAAA